VKQRRDCEPTPGRADATGLAFKGSQLQLQLYANRHTREFEGEAICAGVMPRGAKLEWMSPVAEDGYREYRDQAFLERLSLGLSVPRLRSFWPERGPCWDGLARWSTDSDSGILLLEAKSYPEEARSSLMARSSVSAQLITDALTRTSEWLGQGDVPSAWTMDFYQTANRVAHLYFLREMCGIDASLVFMLVVDDPTHRATSRRQWDRAWRAMWKDMGLVGPPTKTYALHLPGLPRLISPSKSQ
jgi:hypothetical protein